MTGVFFPFTSTASFVGRSRMCPTEAMTLYPFPRYLVMVLALDGLSTITNFRPWPAAPDSLAVGFFRTSAFPEGLRSVAFFRWCQG